MKPLVLASLESADGTRCVDLMDLRDNTFGWVECRRDPEDAHGWRHVGAIRRGFGTAAQAEAAARDAVGWL